MDFNKLNYLIAIAELQSFSKAAKKCFVSQPAFTRECPGVDVQLIEGNALTLEQLLGCF